MNRNKAWVCALAAILGAGAWSEGNAQLSPQMQREIERSAPSQEQMKAQQDMMDRLSKETEQRNALMKGDFMKSQREGLGRFKPAPLAPRPISGGGSEATRRAPAASAPAPSRVTYGETRRYSPGADAKPDAETRPAAPEKPAAPRAPERAPCVYKPVMTDDDLAACR